jgi:hypothetical protein
VERERALLDAGAALRSLALALHAQGIASAWSSAALAHQPEIRTALGMDVAWFAMGTLGCGPPRGPLDTDPPALDLAELATFS